MCFTAFTYVWVYKRTNTYSAVYKGFTDFIFLISNYVKFYIQNIKLENWALHSTHKNIFKIVITTNRMIKLHQKVTNKTYFYILLNCDMKCRKSETMKAGMTDDQLFGWLRIVWWWDKHRCGCTISGRWWVQDRSEVSSKYTLTFGALNYMKSWYNI